MNSASSSSEPSRAPAPLLGPGLAMFLVFVGASSAQFHSYLFESRGFQGLQIGWLIMAGQTAGVLSPPLQVSVIRFFRGPRIPLMIVLIFAGVFLALLPYARTFGMLMLLFPLYSFCATAIFPLNAASAFAAIRERGHGTFFRLRSLGTLGFLVGCVISAFFPTLADLPNLYLGFAGALFLGLIVIGWEHFDSRSDGVNPRSFEAPTFLKALRLLGETKTLKLLIALGVMNFANALATAVQGNYLVDRWHQGQQTISLAWVVSTGCEIPLMLLCVRILHRFGLRHVLAFGIAGTLIKLLGLATANRLWQFYLALTMHGCFFSGALTGFSVYLDRTFRHEESPALQSLSAVFYGGLPSALAGLTAGLVWHSFSLRAVYFLSGGIAVGAAAYAFLQFKNLGKETAKYVL